MTDIPNQQIQKFEGIPNKEDANSIGQILLSMQLSKFEIESKDGIDMIHFFPASLTDICEYIIKGFKISSKPVFKYLKERIGEDRTNIEDYIEIILLDLIENGYVDGFQKEEIKIYTLKIEQLQNYYEAMLQKRSNN